MLDEKMLARASPMTRLHSVLGPRDLQAQPQVSRNWLAEVSALYRTQGLGIGFLSGDLIVVRPRHISQT